MRAAYTRMFQRMGLDFRVVQADTGAIGGSASEEFQVLAASGEDAIAVSDADEFAANVELAPALPPTAPRAAAERSRSSASPPPARAPSTELSALLQVPRRALPEDTDRRGRARAAGGAAAARRSRAQCGQGAEAARRCHSAAHGERRRGAGRDRLRPRLHRTGGADAACASMPITRRSRWPISSAAPTSTTLHLTGVNWGRDLPEPRRADLRNVVAGDPSPSGCGHAAHRARHRGGPHLSARPQIQRGHECHGAR